MKFLISKNNLKNLRFKLAITLGISVLMSAYSYSQMGTLEVRSDISSGIITEIDANHEIGLIQFKIDVVNESVQDIILREFSKYDGEIVNFGLSIAEKKLIVSYRSPSYPNFILGILDRVNIRPYYINLAGLTTTYVKDGYSAFLR